MDCIFRLEGPRFQGDNMQLAVCNEGNIGSLAKPTRDVVLARLFADHYRHLYLFIFARVRRPDESADLASQAFVEACKGFDSFRGESEMPTWLYGIAMNLIRNHVSRAPYRRFEFVGEEGLEDVADSCEDIPRRLQSKQEVTSLQGPMNDLPADLRF
jgi:RNA polymerase sigma factor (sigma-70 family)